MTKTLGHRESYSGKNKFYLLMGIDVGRFHLTFYSNPTHHQTDTVWIQLRNANVVNHHGHILSLSWPNGSHCPSNAYGNNILHIFELVHFCFTGFTEILGGHFGFLTVYVTLYYTKQSKIIIFFFSGLYHFTTFI